MIDSTRKVLGLVKLAVEAEGLTGAGRVNLVGLVLMFLLASAVIAGDLVQGVVRAFRPTFSVGTPTVTLVIVIFAGFLAFCVLILAFVPPRNVGQR